MFKATGSSAVAEREAVETRSKLPAEKPYRDLAGLCRLCDNADHCTFLRNPGQGVFECDEFKVLASAPPMTIAQPGPMARRQPVLVHRGTETTSLQGLCRTCEHRAGCTYARTEGGVWHCEEYR